MLSGSVCASSQASQDIHEGDQHGHILGDILTCRATGSDRDRSPIFGIIQSTPENMWRGQDGAIIRRFLHMRCMVDEVSELKNG